MRGAGLLFLPLENYQKPMEPITKEQLEFIRAEINRSYLYMLDNSDLDPVVIELMKLSAFVEADRRYHSKEPW